MAKNENRFMQKVTEKPELTRAAQAKRELALLGDLDKNDIKNTRKKAGEPRKKAKN